MERNIFKRIQIPGSSPAAANWGCARWGYKTWNELFKAMCGEENDYNSMLEDGEDNALNESMEKLESDENCILNGTKRKLIIDEILNEPLLKKIKLEMKPKLKSDNQSIEFDINSLQCMQPFRNEPKQQKITFPLIKDNEAKFNPNEPSTSTAYFEWQNDGNDQMLNDCVVLEECKKTKPVQTATKAEASHKKNIARTRLMDGRNDKVKTDISMMFWPIESWPAFAVEILFSSDFHYNERLTFATFFHGNGLVDSSLPITILQFYNPNAVSREWKQKLYKFEKLFQYLDKANDTTDELHSEMTRKYYFYSMINKHMMYYNGDKRKNGKPENFLRNDKWQY